MKNRSPLLVSALELVAHAIDLYLQANHRKYKFIVLHLANAVELVLKDRVLLAGISIYTDERPRPRTIGIWRAFDLLANEGIEIAERPFVELLVDDRNTLQHRFGFPDAISVHYYLEQVVAFFNRFLEAEYEADLAAEIRYCLEEESFELLKLIIEKDEAVYLPKLFRISPEVAAEKLHNAISEEILGIVETYSVRRMPQVLYIRRTLEYLEQGGWLSEGLSESFSPHSPPVGDQEFENSTELLLELKRIRRLDPVPKIAGVTVDSEENASESVSDRVQ
jgi:hypothetical protein